MTIMGVLLKVSKLYLSYYKSIIFSVTIDNCHCPLQFAGPLAYPTCQCLLRLPVIYGCPSFTVARHYQLLVAIAR